MDALRFGLVVVLTCGISLATAGVVGADTPQEGSDTVSAGSGSQFGRWSKSNKRLRLKVSPNNNMNTDKCMDVMLDWGTQGNEHYDSRVVRSCLPGTNEETDPDGDGYWSEPSDWGGRTVTGIQKGWGYMIDDSNLLVLSAERLADTGSGALWGTAPGTGTQGYARMRTRYQNGSVKSCNPLPVTSASGAGGCS
ncbi:hypothetical protein [Nocardioides sp. GY 10127]|uniref:hypothetical protein n=1 Tax=Nocardioides sp. GY 10127 TaxID=2569762 RepID=UPI0010A87305|nr:hypothetical protein [Nocardioides sp. GY 10127]TIC79001.1 hypothetical protein E8D37_18435 [Nocardioides sp. GY 10127]